MASYFPADIRGQKVVIGRRGLSKKQAMRRIRDGDSVYARKSSAKTLAIALSDGDPHTWKDDAHVVGGYKHFHDSTHKYGGHIFYGEPVG